MYHKLEESNDLVKLGEGRVSLKGPTLALFNYFDNVFLKLALSKGSLEIKFPTIIQKVSLEKADYFKSFPSLAVRIDKSNYLSPAVCYHLYQSLEGQVLDTDPILFTSVGRCFRNEKKLNELSGRLWDFTMREIIVIGRQSTVEEFRQECMEEVITFQNKLGLSGRVEKASDPFFTASENRGKYLLQKLKPLKYELKLDLDDSQSVAVASFNNHEEFFGDHFSIEIKNTGIASSVCIAFGLERWVIAFLTQYGFEQEGWPKSINDQIRK